MMAQNMPLPRAKATIIWFFDEYDKAEQEASSCQVELVV